MDSRLLKIIKILSDYAKGDFGRSILISPQMDVIDGLSAGINILGQELKSTTVSKEYFNNIFDSDTNMLFVLNLKGIILDMNQEVFVKLGYQKEELLGTPIKSLQEFSGKTINESLLKRIASSEKGFQMESYFKTKLDNFLTVLISIASLKLNHSSKSGMLLVANTEHQENKIQIVRSIIDGQERERSRISRDLHDGICQRLSAIHFKLTEIFKMDGSHGRDKQKSGILEDLRGVKDEVRSICLDLAPLSLKQEGLVNAINEIMLDPEYQGRVDFNLEIKPGFPILSLELEIDLVRTIREFISNALHHGQSTEITMCFSLSKDHIHIVLKDNGRGFDTGMYISSGLGIHNVRARIGSHYGRINIISAPGKGTTYRIKIPLLG